MSPSGKLSIFLCCLLFLCGTVSCISTQKTLSARQDPATPAATHLHEKWSLWTRGTQLRGANIYQRRIYPELDGREFLGPGPFGPPYTQADLDRLADLGANYVNISHPGLFTDTEPFGVDEQAVANLDRLLEMVARADMFAVLTFRTGPGRNEFSILGTGDWAPASYLIDILWQDQAAQEAWIRMWAYTAGRYRQNPILAGYDLMCEPNSNASLDIWEPEDFYTQHAGSLLDWNQLYPRIVAAVRAVDADTPILIGGNGYSGPAWLPYLQTLSEAHIVYTMHQYNPHVYTHQEFQEGLSRTYPGRFDANYDGQSEEVDLLWLANMLSSAVEFQAHNGVPLAVNEYGLERWVPGAADFLRDEMTLFETHGWNYAIWQWHASWPPLAEGDNSFNFLFGPDPRNLAEVPTSDMIEVIKEFWSRNTLRPSNFSTQSP